MKHALTTLAAASTLAFAVLSSSCNKATGPWTDPAIPSDATDLSAAGTANCYIVSPGSVSVLDASVKDNNPTFTNSYEAGSVTLSGDSALKVTKKVEGAPATEEFAFGLKLSSTSAGKLENVWVGAEEGSKQLDEEGITAYRGLFRELLALEEGAALWHCSAGKDRCGLASVLVETALGVPWALVEKDYLATNELIEAKGSAQNMFDVGGVDVRYLRAALDAINEAYGSLDGYLANALGVDAGAREELRRKFVAA